MSLHRLEFFLLFWGIVCGPIVAYYFFRFRTARQYGVIVNALGSKDDSKGTALANVAQALTRINSESQRLLFNLERGDQINFRGQPLWIVLGNVISNEATDTSFTGGWFSLGESEYVYVVAQTLDQADWLKDNADVFLPTPKDSTGRVFTVNVPALLRAYKAQAGNYDGLSHEIANTSSE